MNFDVLGVWKAEIMKLSCHIYTNITPMPWLFFVIIDKRSILVAFCESIFMRIFSHPFYIISITSNGIILRFIHCIKKIKSDPKLMFAISRWSTKSSIITTSKIPNSLLICSTSKATNNNNRLLKIFIKMSCKRVKMWFNISSSTTWSTCLINKISLNWYQVSRSIIAIIERCINAYIAKKTFVVCHFWPEKRFFKSEKLNRLKISWINEFFKRGFIRKCWRDAYF